MYNILVGCGLKEMMHAPLRLLSPQRQWTISSNLSSCGLSSTRSTLASTFSHLSQTATIAEMELEKAKSVCAATHEERSRAAATLLQRHGRGLAARVRFTAVRRLQAAAASKIQAMSRGRLEVLKFRVAVHAAIAMQLAWRRRAARRLVAGLRAERSRRPRARQQDLETP